MDALVQLVHRHLEAELVWNCFVGPSGLGWTRDWGWKLDVVDVQGVLQGIVVNLYVWLPSRPTGDGGFEQQSLAIRALPHLAGEGQGSFRFSGKLPRAKVLSRIVGSLDAGFRWYEQFDTRRKCLDFIKADARRPLPPASQDAMNYLLGLPPDFDLPCCSLERVPISD